MSDLAVEHVTKEYPTRGEPLVVLRDVSLSLDRGRSAAIVGPSGSGKSTLLNVIGTLDAPTSGSVSIAGENPYALRESKLAHFRNRHIGFVFQEHFLLPQLSLLENVLLPTLADGSPQAAQVERARDLIERVGLSGRVEHRPAELSGGERQRAAVARALILGPELLLADEPTGSLDRDNALSVGRMLLDLRKQENVMLLVVTHSMELADLMDRRLELNGGRLSG
jgi:lipoprotein-releasing system ATP-binding protein